MVEHRQQRPTEPMKGIPSESRPSKSQILAVVTLSPAGGLLLLLLLLLLSGLTLTGTLIGLAVTIPLFLVFSPVLVPAALTLALAVAGFLTSGAFGITALSSFSWIVSYLRRARLPGHEMSQKAREVGKRGVTRFSVCDGYCVGEGLICSMV